MDAPLYDPASEEGDAGDMEGVQGEGDAAVCEEEEETTRRGRRDLILRGRARAEGDTKVGPVGAEACDAGGANARDDAVE